eukprot:8741266-Pyramimonas_sp.AAC.1
MGPDEPSMVYIALVAMMMAEVVDHSGERKAAWRSRESTAEARESAPNTTIQQSPQQVKACTYELPMATPD